MKAFCLPLLVLSASSAWAVDPGFSDDFDGTSWPAADTWTWGGDVTPEIVEDPAASGTNWLEMSTAEGEDGYLQLAGPTSEYDALWYDFEAVLAPRSSDPAVDSNTRSAFYMTAAGDLRIRDGSSWVDASTGLNTADPHEFNIKLNFVDSTWSLWVNGNEVVAGGATIFDFVSAGTTSGGLRIQQEGLATSNLDDVAVREETVETGPTRISLPFFDGFEDRGPGALADAPGDWTIGDSGPSGEIKAGIGADSSRGLEFVSGSGETASLVLHLPAHWQPVTWKQFDAVLAPYADDADPTVDSDSTVAFFLTASGDIQARDGSSWVTLDFDPNLDTSQMHRYSVRQDHAAKTWQLWVNGEKVNPVSGDQPFDFANNSTDPGFLRITQNQSQTAVFDNVRVTSGPPVDGPGSLNNYNAWSGGITWGGADSGVADDPNSNTLSNLLEYGFGFADPVNGTHGYTTPVEMGSTDGTATFTFRRYRWAEDLVFTVEASPDLSAGSWTELAPEVADVTVTPSADPEVDLITIELVVTDENQFLRLRVEAP